MAAATCSTSTSSPRGPTRAVGNYGEVFERNIGQGSSLKLPRG